MCRGKRKKVLDSDLDGEDGSLILKSVAGREGTRTYPATSISFFSLPAVARECWGNHQNFPHSTHVHQAVPPPSTWNLPPTGNHPPWRFLRFWGAFSGWSFDHLRASRSIERLFSTEVRVGEKKNSILGEASTFLSCTSIPHFQTTVMQFNATGSELATPSKSFFLCSLPFVFVAAPLLVRVGALRASWSHARRR